MNKVAVVFWSGTGNTEAMAKAVADGVNGAGGEAVLLQPANYTAALAALKDKMVKSWAYFAYYVNTSGRFDIDFPL